MKVGIITINGNENYGNVLQNYAVQEVLKEVGADGETITNLTQYGHSINTEKKIKKFTLSYIKKYITSQLNYRYNIKNSNQGLLKVIKFYYNNKDKIESIKEVRKKNFIQFKNEYIKHSKYNLDINKPWLSEQIDEYSYFVSGSDQVWNPTYPSTSSINFLQFAPEEKRISISPSFGINKIPKELEEDYKTWLEGIPNLSVREEQGKKIIKDLCGREAKVLCDPTMAISQKKWIEVEEKPNYLKNSKYILTYFLGDKTKEYDKFINSIAQKENLDIINLFDVTDLRAYATSPQEFLYLIHHAALVCTDSFHGAVFSIIMNTDFITFSRKETGNSMESRMQTLLSKFELENRDYKKINREDIFNLNFSHTKDILKTCKDEMIDFLKEAMIKKVEKNKNKEKGQIIFENKEKCCGCNACVTICPKQCILMEEDEEGFLYPKINQELCIHCNRCQEVCPVIKNKRNENSEILCYAAYSKDEEIRKKSSSGGIFTELSKQVFLANGIVYGAGFTKEFEVEHQSSCSEIELSKLRGSKYVQSYIGNSYKEIKEKLEEGKFIYFSGTPCQVKGLYTYLNKEYNNLVTQDIICHGVSSPLVWRKYISKYSNLEKISFRNKKFGWHYFSMYIKDKKEKYIRRLNEDFFIRLFLDNTILRPICYNCPIKENGSWADITLADCWGSNKFCKEMKDNDKGISLVIINSKQGKKLWNNVIEKNNIKKEHLDTEKALKSQSALFKSAPCNSKRSVFFTELRRVEFQILEKIWYRDSLIYRLRKKEIYIKTKILFLLKNIVKK